MPDKKYSVSYEYNNKIYVTSIYAGSFDEAEQHVQALSDARLDGELVYEVNVGKSDGT